MACRISPFLSRAQAQVYVRPCAINEFLSPGNRDECLACKEGFYNLDTEAVRTAALYGNVPPYRHNRACHLLATSA